MDNSLRFANAFDASANACDRTVGLPDPKTASAHIAIAATAAANPANEHAGEHQEIRSCA
jgi:hypothetical protein